MHEPSLLPLLVFCLSARLWVKLVCLCLKEKHRVGFTKAARGAGAVQRLMTLALLTTSGSPRDGPLGAHFFEQRHQIFGVFFFHRQDSFHQPPRRGVIIAKVPDHLAITINGDPLRD
jgi:hypothetical protein